MKPWTTLDLEALRYLGPRLGGPETAAALGRSLSSVKSQAHRIGVRLRRSAIRATNLQPLGPEALNRRIRELAEASLCPACGAAPASVRKTGLCARCHCAARVALHTEEIAWIEGRRERAAARQKLQRRRRGALPRGQRAQVSPGTDPKTCDGPAKLDA